MKRLVLFTWVLMQIIIPTLISEHYFTISIQLELAFFAFALWYFNKILTKSELNTILSVFSVYYIYILLTDSLIDFIPVYLVYIEAFIVWLIISCKFDKVK